MIDRDPSTEASRSPRRALILALGAVFALAALVLPLVINANPAQRSETPQALPDVAPTEMREELRPAPTQQDTRARSTPDSAATSHRAAQEIATDALVHGTIHDWQSQSVILVFRDEAKLLHFAALDPHQSAYQLRLPASHYQAYLHSPAAPTLRADLTVSDRDRELALNFAPQWWPSLRVDLYARGGTSLLEALPHTLYAWQRELGLDALGLRLCYGAQDVVLDPGEPCVLRTALPVDTRLCWNELVLGEQRVHSRDQRIAFEIDPDIFQRGPSASLSFDLVNAEDGQPYHGAQVELRDAFLTRVIPLADTRARIHCEDLAPGEVLLRVGAKPPFDYAATYLLEAGEERDLGTLHCVPSRAPALTPGVLRRGCMLHILALEPVQLYRLESSQVELLQRFEKPTVAWIELVPGAYVWRSPDQAHQGAFDVPAEGEMPIITWP